MGEIKLQTKEQKEFKVPDLGGATLIVDGRVTHIEARGKEDKEAQKRYLKRPTETFIHEANYELG